MTGTAAAIVAVCLLTPYHLEAQGGPPAAMLPCGIPPGGAPAGGARPGGAEGAPGQDTLRVTPVQGSVYMLSGAGGNITVQVGRDGALLVDSGRADMADAVVAAVRQLTPQPVRLIINTAADADHAGGNEGVARAGERFQTSTFGVGGATPGAAILARQAVMNRMIAEGAPECAFPTSTYDLFSMRSEFFNGEGIELRHMPAAHSDGDSVVFFRRSDVVSTGDIFNTSLYPVIDIEHGGSVQGVIAALNELLQITIPALKEEGGTYVIPGHGRIADEADVTEYRDMVTIVRDRIQSLIEGGMTLEQVVAERPTLDYDGRYGATEGPSTTAQFIEAVYRSLEAAAGGRR